MLHTSKGMLAKKCPRLLLRKKSMKDIGVCVLSTAKAVIMLVWSCGDGNLFSAGRGGNSSSYLQIFFVCACLCKRCSSMSSV